MTRIAAVAVVALTVSAPAFAQSQGAPPPEAFPPYVPDWLSGDRPQKPTAGDLCRCWQIEWTHKAQREAPLARFSRRITFRRKAATTLSLRTIRLSRANGLQ